jgi:DnaJ homolog subfamily C member 19
VSKLLVAIAILVGIWWMNKRRRQTGLSVREARDLLEVHGDADVENIRAAHRRLMARVHPDAGGSAALASRVNAARDLLVAEYNRTRD